MHKKNLRQRVKKDKPSFGKKSASKKIWGQKDSLKHSHTKAKDAPIHGTLFIIARGGGFVRSDDYPEEIKIYEENLGTGLHGDEVVVQIKAKKKNETTGIITDIGVRAKTEFTGVLVEKDGVYFLKPSDPKMYTYIKIPKKHLADATPGERVYGTLTDWPNPNKEPEGAILRTLGKPGEHETEMQAIALERGFTEDFPKEVLEEAQIIDKKGIIPSDIDGRRDFRKVPTFTIDPVDAKDFDDAISVLPLANGDVEIGIHIADVSHYVQPKTELDTEALERGTSVYLVDRTIPMLPRVLSDDLCSLLPRVDRLTMSTVVTFGRDGTEKDVWFGPSVIHSAERFTYESAQDLLDGKTEHPLKEELHLAAHIARILGKARAKNGALILESEEIKVLIDKDGKPEKIVKKIRTESHTLIEELMLLANRKIAVFLENGGYKKNTTGTENTVLYRVHDKPSVEKADDLAFFMRSIGHPITLAKDGSIEPRALINVLKKFDGSDLKDTVLAFVVRSMAKAVYTTKNIGHYGLQFTHYTHFTSPIRRYPDLVIHRMLRYTLAGKPAPSNTRKAYERIARLTSMAEVRAAEAERESVKLKLTEYMAVRIGQEVVGVITGVTEWGLYVKDKETTAEGLIPLRTLGDDRWTLNPKLATITGEVSQRSFRIGDTIKVRIAGANPEKRQIDYEAIT